ncbi:MAG TPA: gluconokinase [Thermoanaerobaculia bacterium]
MNDLALLGIDLGSSSARAFVYDAAGTPLGGGRVPYAWLTASDGALEVAAERLVEATAAAVDAALAFTREKEIRIAAVGLSAFWHGLVGVNAEGDPVTPVYSWGDTRASLAAAEMRKRAGEAAMHRRTGAYLHPSFPAAKLRWLKRERPDLAARVARWMSAGEYLQLRMLGAGTGGVSMASASGLLDQNRVAWDEEALTLAEVTAAALPSLDPRDAPAGVAGEFAQRWPELAGVPWTEAIGDGACANIGSGCADVRAAALSVGTTAAVRVVRRAESIAIPDDLFCYRVDRARFILGGATSNGGNVFAWGKATLRLTDAQPAGLDAHLDGRAPDAHGLTVLPFLAGERSPWWPLGARAAIAGISVATTPLDILQASLEAVAYRLALIRAGLRSTVPEAGRVVASGRALTESPAFARIVCDVLGEPLHLSSFGETSSRGAALLAGEMIGAVDPAAVPPPAAAVLQPDAERHEVYRRAIERQAALERALIT